MTKEEGKLLEEAARQDGRSRNGFLRKLIRDLNQPLRDARLFDGSKKDGKSL